MPTYYVKLPFNGILTTTVEAENEQEAIEWAMGNMDYGSMGYQVYGSMKVLDFDKDNIKVDLAKKQYEAGK